MRLNSSQRKRIRRISLTPLIDVVFLLLIFFMLSSSFLKFINISVGGTSSGNAVNPTREEVVLILLEDEEKITVEGEEVELNQLKETLDKISETGKQKAAIQAVGNIKSQRILEVLHRAKLSKMKNIFLTHNEESKEQ